MSNSAVKVLFTNKMVGLNKVVEKNDRGWYRVKFGEFNTYNSKNEFYLDTGLKELLEETEDWIAREKYWVSYYKQRTELVNSTSGGEDVFKKDKNSVKRSSEAKFTPIIQFSLFGDIIQEWDCIRDATIALGLARNSIKNNLRGRSATCGGFIWKYKNKETPESGRKAFTKHKKWIE